MPLDTRAQSATITHMTNLLFETAKQYLGTGALVRLVFTKKDGTERVLIGTRNLDRIPTELHPKGSETEKKSDAFPVYDVDAGGWRSFKPDTLKAVELLPEASA
jgi:hypothetical protein